MTVSILIGDCREMLATLPAESVQCVVTSLSETQIAYLAGLIDGEGSLECQRQNQPNGVTPRYVLRLSFVFGTPEPITTIAGWFGDAPKQYPPPSDRHSPRWRWHMPKGTAVPVLIRVLPYLILKRPQAESVLKIEAIRAMHSVPRTIKGPRSNLRMPQSAVEAMESEHQRLRAMKSSKRRSV